jgi:hypothetical protein
MTVFAREYYSQSNDLSNRMSLLVCFGINSGILREYSVARSFERSGRYFGL